MAEFTAALDETGANKLLDTAINAFPAQTNSGSGSLGPFGVSYSVTGDLSNGNVDLIPPNTIRIVDLTLDWHLNFELIIDLNKVLPNFCIPQVCIDIPCIGEVCTPEICVSWPVIKVPVSFGDFVKTTADFELVVSQSGGKWQVHAKILGVPNLQFGATTALLLAAIGAALTPVLLLVPFIGPFLALAVNAILAAIGIAGLLGWLGPLLTPFVAGMQILLYERSKVLQILPPQLPLDPAVDITIDLLAASIQHDGEDEMIVTAEISG